MNTWVAIIRHPENVVHAAFTIIKDEKLVLQFACSGPTDEGVLEWHASSYCGWLACGTDESTKCERCERVFILQELGK